MPGSDPPYRARSGADKVTCDLCSTPTIHGVRFALKSRLIIVVDKYFEKWRAPRFCSCAWRLAPMHRAQQQLRRRAWRGWGLGFSWSSFSACWRCAAVWWGRTPASHGARARHTTSFPRMSTNARPLTAPIPRAPRAPPSSARPLSRQMILPAVVVFTIVLLVLLLARRTPDPSAGQAVSGRYTLESSK